MIDWERVAQLQEEVGEDDFQEVADMFLDEMGDEVEALSSNMNVQEMEAKLHFLKGAALNLGLSGFAELCRAGEEMARAGQLAGIDAGAIITCYHASIEEFSSILSDSAAA